MNYLALLSFVATTVMIVVAAIRPSNAKATAFEAIVGLSAIALSLLLSGSILWEAL